MCSLTNLIHSLPNTISVVVITSYKSDVKKSLDCQIDGGFINSRDCIHSLDVSRLHIWTRSYSINQNRT